MTTLSRTVRRVVARDRRNLVVTLRPAVGDFLPASIEIREARRREGYRIGLPALFVLLATRAAENRRAAKKGNRP